MLAMQQAARPAATTNAVRPCPNCGRSMYLARIVPQADGRLELATYRCGECGISRKETAEGGAVAERQA